MPSPLRFAQLVPAGAPPPTAAGGDRAIDGDSAAPTPDVQRALNRDETVLRGKIWAGILPEVLRNVPRGMAVRVLGSLRGSYC